MARAGALCVLRVCGSPRRAGLPLCRKHWAMVPRDLQQAEFEALTNRRVATRRIVCRQAVVEVERILRNGERVDV